MDNQSAYWTSINKLSAMFDNPQLTEIDRGRAVAQLLTDFSEVLTPKQKAEIRLAASTQKVRANRLS